MNIIRDIEEYLYTTTFGLTNHYLLFIYDKSKALQEQLKYEINRRN
jgi:hypothetical protein